MIKFPYGVSDFDSIITEDYFYIDKTQYIHDLEEIGKYILFLRPRRFGKSLLLNMLTNYYDIVKENDFDRLFGNLTIGKNPTPLQNKYFILEFDFSCVATYGNSEDIEKSLFNSIISSIRGFCIKYEKYLSKTVNMDNQDPMGIFKELLSIIHVMGFKIYLFIDEYDNFANDVLASSGQDRYFEITGIEQPLEICFPGNQGRHKGHGD